MKSYKFTLSNISGTGLGPFNLFSESDLVTPFEIGITREQLIDGFISNNIPDNDFEIIIVSTGVCGNSIQVMLDIIYCISLNRYGYDCDVSTEITPSKIVYIKAADIIATAVGYDVIMYSDSLATVLVDDIFLPAFIGPGIYFSVISFPEDLSGLRLVPDNIDRWNGSFIIPGECL